MTLQSLDNIRQRLLDISKRNQLLSYKEKARTVHIVDTLPETIFNKLVLEGKSMTFVAQPQYHVARASTPIIDFYDETLPPPDSASIKENAKNEMLLQTAHDEEVLEQRCKKLAREARNALEETGSNLLYLAAGFLEWYEDKNATVPLKAPLMLIPVKLERVLLPRSPIYNYVLSYRDQDIETNMSLAEKLANDFNLALPAFSDEIPPTTYLEAVAKVAQVMPRWQVVPDIRLDFFSFTKLLMYKDLNNENWPEHAKLTDNANLKQILGTTDLDVTDTIAKSDSISIQSDATDAAAKSNSISIHPDVTDTIAKSDSISIQSDATDTIAQSDSISIVQSDSISRTLSDDLIDTNPLADKTPLILDADSSQQVVIMEALWKQANLVVEGPPGTGKSQTITNLIAATLYQGKSVLFVAEKKAALDVVRSRLDNVGLGEFCLELHSHKTQKSEVHADLNRRFNKEFQDVTELERDIQELTAQKQQLLAYSNLINTIVGPNNDRIYEVFWVVERLRGELAGEKPHFEVQDALQMSSNDLNQKMSKLTELGGQYESVSEEAIQHWQGFKPTNIWPGDEEVIRPTLSMLFLETQAYEAYLDVLIEETQIPLTKDLTTLQSLTKIDAAQLTQVPVPFDTSAAVQLLEPWAREQLQQFQAEQTEYRQLLNQSIKFLGYGKYSNKLLQQLANTTGQLEKLSFGNHSPDELMFLIESIDKLDDEVQSLLNNPASVAEFLKFLQLRELAEQAPQDLVLNKHPEHALEATPIVFQNVRHLFSELTVQWTVQKKDFLLSKLPNSEKIAILADELRKHQGKLLAFLSADYRRAKKTVQNFLATSKPNTRNLIKRLEALAALKRQTELETQREQSQRLFGPLFVGLETDWARLERHIVWAQRLGKVLGMPEEAKMLLATQAEPRSYILKTTAVLYEQWLRVTKAAEQLHVPITHHLGVNKFVKQLLERRNFVEQLASGLQRQLPHLTDKHVLSIYSAVQSLLRAWHLRNDAIQNQLLIKLFGKTYQGIETNVTALCAIADWINHLQTTSNLPPPLLHWLVSNEPTARLPICIVLLNKNQRYLDLYTGFCQKMATFGQLNTQQWFHCGDKPCTLAHIAKTASTCQASVNSLGTLATFYVLKQEADKMGLNVITEAITSRQIQSKQAALHFQYAVYQSMARGLIRQYAALATFTRSGYENIRQRFAELDKQLQKATRQRIAYQIQERPIPQGNGTGKVSTFTEKCLIEHELNKRRQHLPIRQLVRRATGALRALKPCFMMSPLSVAQYLPPGQVEFDLLIMDEASQVRPEDALGAIARSKQIVIVGDPKQLPPTQFFERLVNEEEETTALDGQESILDICLSTYQKGRLRWHYRSEHESLIAFSNHHFYDDELIVFPASQAKHRGCGVHLNYVEKATYLKGCNQKEAEAIVVAVEAHFKNHPALSLGIATFNLKQQELINDVLEKRCQQDTWLEEQLKATENTTEPFFIKNLENVQGDERDVIFVSTTYGPDPITGRVFQRFGPISGKMGWRRLNVIFTRAKKRLELFTSMRSSDIQLKSHAKGGVQILKTYLEYAETGLLPDTSNLIGKEGDSDFEIAVSKILQEHGYKTVPQVGVAGFRIDIAVCHPERAGEYIVGIEYDGTNYHSAKSVRDRDRLRQEILESKGWKIHRIWSSDWYKNRDAEIERLLKALTVVKEEHQAEEIVPG